MRALIALLSLGLLLTGCSSIKVDHDYDTEYNFSTLKTWQWAPWAGNTNKNPLVDNGLVDERAQNSITSGLTQRGFTLAKDKPDFVVSYQIILEQPAVITQEPSVGVGMGGGSGGSSFGGVSFSFGTGGQPSPRELLIIDIKQPADGKLIWRGSAKQTVKNSSDPEEANKRMTETVNAILNTFPPK